MTKRILLTGAGGFVGHHTLEHILTTTDWDVVCTDSFRHAGKVDRISEVLASAPAHVNWRVDPDSLERTWWDRVTVVTQDLTVPFSDQTAEKIGHVDYIISMASESHVDRSISHPAEFISNNVSLVINLLEFHRRHVPDAIFLQVSTDEVYGPAPEGHNHAEWEPFLPSNPYSASKAAQESIAFSYWRTYGTPLILTSTMNIVGERQDTEKYLPMTISKIRSGETVHIHSSPEGVPGSRYYLHARNQADALLYLLKAYSGGLDSDQQYQFFGVADQLRKTEGEALVYENNMSRPPKYNIVGELELDNKQLAEMVASAMDLPLVYEKVDFHSSRPGHDLRYALDGSKMASIGWTHPVPLEESIRKTVKWTLENERWLL